MSGITIIKTIVFTFFILLIAIVFFTSRGEAISTNIDPVYRYAWNDVLGWINFYNTNNALGNNIFVANTSMKGYTSSSQGDFSLDCSTSRNGNICSTSNYGVCNGKTTHNQDGACDPYGTGVGQGELTGWIWNDFVGWINLNCWNQDTCGLSNYKTVINSQTGEFSGWAWNDILGWISFNCQNNNSCGVSDYKVKTSWRGNAVSEGFLISETFDTQKTGNQLNSIIWHGALNNGIVDFQIATSNNPLGPWNFYGPHCSSCNPVTDYYGALCPNIGSAASFGNDTIPGAPICVDTDTTGFRYLRYKVRLRSDVNQVHAPVIKDIILNWSP